MMDESKLVTLIKRFMDESSYGPEILRLKNIEILNTHWTTHNTLDSSGAAVGQMFINEGDIYLYNPDKSPSDVRMDYLLETLIHEYGHMTNVWYFADSNKKQVYRDWNNLLSNNDGVQVPQRVNGSGLIQSSSFRINILRDYYKQMGKTYIDLIKKYFDPNVSYDDIHLTPLTRNISRYVTGITELLTRTWTDLTMRFHKNWMDEYVSGAVTEDVNIFESTWGGTDNSAFQPSILADPVSYIPKFSQMFQGFSTTKKHDFQNEWSDAQEFFHGSDDNSPLTKTASNALEFYKNAYRLNNDYSNSYILDGNLHINMMLTDAEAAKYSGLMITDNNTGTNTLANLNTIGRYLNITKSYALVNDATTYESWGKKQYEAVIPYSPHSQYTLKLFEDKNNDNKPSPDELINFNNPYIGSFHQAIDQIYNVDSNITSSLSRNELNLKI